MDLGRSVNAVLLLKKLVIHFYFNLLSVLAFLWMILRFVIHVGSNNVALNLIICTASLSPLASSMVLTVDFMF